MAKPKTQKPEKKTITHATPQESVPTMYANYVRTSSSRNDFRILLSEVIDDSADGLIVRDNMRLFLTPIIAKTFLTVLGRAVESYEERWGEIQLDPSLAAPKGSKQVS